MNSKLSQENWHFLLHNSYLSPRHKILYISTPKVACTSLKWWIAQLEGYTAEIQRFKGSLESSPELVIHDTFHKVAPNVTIFDKQSFTSLFSNSEITRFAVVRNPYKRIFSAWQSKLLLQEPMQSAPYVKYDFFKTHVSTPEEVAQAFEAFLEHLSSEEAPKFWDLHWTPQADLLRPDVVPYTLIAQLEDTERLEATLQAALGEHFINPFTNSNANESLIPFSTQFFTQRSIQLIEQLYHSDFEHFGYEKKLPKSKTTQGEEAFKTAIKGIEMIKSRHARIAEFSQTITSTKAQLQEQQNLDKERTALLEKELSANKSLQERIFQLKQELIEKSELTKKYSDALNKQEKMLYVYGKALEQIFSSKIWRFQTWASGSKKSSRKHLKNLLRENLNFDSDKYLDSNQDVALSNLSAEEHLLAFGVQEKRLYSEYLEISPPTKIEPKECKPSSSSLQPTHDTNREESLSNTRDSNFDLDFYLMLYPDVRAANIDPYEHYQHHGRAEGRIASLPPLKIRGNIDSFDPKLKTVMVVSHEASRSGAPILSLNLAQRFSHKYNTIVMLLEGGELEEAFTSPNMLVIGPLETRGNPILASKMLKNALDKFKIDLAIVNSIVSSTVLPALAERFIPSVSLIHEFAAYTRPKEIFREALLWSGDVVFSADLTLQSAQLEFPELLKRTTHILPQGRCITPQENIPPDAMENERNKIRNALRPIQSHPDTVVILGAGYVQLRKGVDLFIECALRVVQQPGGEKCRFVWIGQGYDPDQDANYSVYLADQVRRSGLEGVVKFIPETPAIDSAYKEADALLLTSRLDPLPNVAIDAMDHGLPVFCFDKATGVADFLQNNGLGDECVAPYLDTVAMANIILELASAKKRKNDLGERCRTKSRKYFDMSRYIAGLEKISEQVKAKCEQEKIDLAVLEKSELPQLDFMLPQTITEIERTKALHLYIRNWASGIDRRKPFPGFHPGIYFEQKSHSVGLADPLADFIRAGNPNGPWLLPVLSPQSAVGKPSPTLRTALHIHACNPSLLAEILRRLALNDIQPDLYISFTNTDTREQTIKTLEHFKINSVKLADTSSNECHFNSLLNTFAPELFNDYDVIGHLHTGKAADTLLEKQGQFHFLVENLLGSDQHPMVDLILGKMCRDPSLGMVFPDDPHVMSKSSLLPENLAAHINQPIENLPEHSYTVTGSMFWARSSLLASLHSKTDSINAENLLPIDNINAHALDYLLPIHCIRSGYTLTLTNIPDNTY